MSASRSHFLGRQFAGPAAALLLLSLTASVESATFEWADPVDGSFKEAAKWNLTSGAGTPPPDVGDNVEFNEAGAYMIELTLDHFSDQIHVSAGDVTLASNSTTLREYLVSSGAADANISGGTLQIGTATNPLFLNLPNTTSSAGLNISVMNIGSGADGFVTVAGLNSRLDVLGNTNHSVGLSGANGALTVQDGATANIGTQGGTLRVGVSSNSASRGDIIVAGGGSLNMGHVEVGTNTSGAIGVINVAGNGSQFVQTLVGANLTLGQRQRRARGTSSLRWLGHHRHGELYRQRDRPDNHQRRQAQCAGQLVIARNGQPHLLRRRDRCARRHLLTQFQFVRLRRHGRCKSTLQGDQWGHGRCLCRY